MRESIKFPTLGIHVQRFHSFSTNLPLPRSRVRVCVTASLNKILWRCYFADDVLLSTSSRVLAPATPDPVQGETKCLICYESKNVCQQLQNAELLCSMFLGARWWGVWIVPRRPRQRKRRKVRSSTSTPPSRCVGGGEEIAQIRHTFTVQFFPKQMRTALRRNKKR